ncbi:MAG: hypothetical protein IT365_12125 [Candidatus Hydrogenedentes bacterium]|nr:hypothetical protein [Candidatus Hydrogenedentota bacterium]
MSRVVLIAALAACMLPGCGALRYADYKLPAVRFDRAMNGPLPSADSEAARNAVARWQQMDEAQRAQYPTPYHAYVNTPAPGTFEGGYTVAAAFSGGGTRGVVFGAECVRLLRELGPIHIERAERSEAIDLFSELDYISGVSTGAVPAALLALSYGEHCPEAMRLEHWPDCLNANVSGVGWRHLAARPDKLVRNLAFDINTRSALAGAIAATFFEGKAGYPASGLTFGDLPQRPVLIIGATIINDPGVPLMETRLPYRYALDERPQYPWQTRLQSFETFHTDPMSYPLGMASCDSSSFPGNVRSGLLAVHPEQDWVYEGLDTAAMERMRAARAQLGYEGVYSIKDGGLVDNRGAYCIHRLYERISKDRTDGARPLLIGLDAGFLEVRSPKPGDRLLKKSWMDELQASMRTSWQTGQDGYNQLVEAAAAQRTYDYVRFRLTSWVRFMASEASVDNSPEGAHLLTLCHEEPLVGTPETLLHVVRNIGTKFSRLTPQELAATKLCARFAVWLERDALLTWVRDNNGGAKASWTQTPKN